MLTLLIADEHPIVRIGIKQILATLEAWEVIETASVPELRQILTTVTPDIIVLGFDISGGNALGLIRELRLAFPRLAILVLSICSGYNESVEAIRAGAHGFLSKNDPPVALLEAIGQLAKGNIYVTPMVGQALAARASTEYRLKHEALSAREYAVLLRIAQGLTTAAIAQQLDLSPKTVGTYRTRLLKKMNLLNTAELTRYVIEHHLG
jgi:two-component system, NarL family, invasion response regulator UvrY